MTAPQGTQQPDQRRPDCARPGTSPVRVGFVTPWNQRCGLSTYAKFCIPHLGASAVAIFAETEVQVVGCDEPHVVRCWQRTAAAPKGGDYSQLEAAIGRANLDIIHVNGQPDFFVQPIFSEMLQRLQSSGMKIVVHIHQLFTLRAANIELLKVADKVIVHSTENRLEAVAHGAKPENVVVIPHGVDIRTDLVGKTKESLRAKLAIQHTGALVTSFGFIQPHKGMEAVIEAVAHLRTRGVDARGLIIGESREDQPGSAEYLRALKDCVKANNLSEQITFISTFISDAQVGEYLAASDLVVANYKSTYFEASGACSLAVGVGAVVMSSLAPALMSFGDAVWHMTGGYPAGLSAELLLSNRALYEEVRRNAHAYAEAHAWPHVAEMIRGVYDDLFAKAEDRPSYRLQPQSGVTSMKPMEVGAARPIRVLMQNRSGTFTHRGGDTVVLERLSQGLSQRGCQVKVDVTGSEDPTQYDLVHLFNFATPDLTQRLAERAKAAGVPFVVTTLYEDLPQFHHQSHAVALHLMDYVSRKQDRGWWAGMRLDLTRVSPAERFKADWLVANAAALFSNGGGESAALRRDFPQVEQVVEVQLGHEVSGMADSDLFRREYGVTDFVLCVGRIETRKNQLMLLKALEDSDLTVVLAGGGFSYQPEYEAAVRAFRRKGRTIILERLTSEMLSSAYAACRIHVLPSWYELPGLVSLEAAAHGKNIVVTRTGTSADYVGDKAFYCQPWDSDSINAAVTAAFYAPVKEGLVEMVKSYTWDSTVDKTLSAYEAIVEGASVKIGEALQATPVGGCYDMSVDAKQYDSLIEEGEIAARDGEYERAEIILRRVEVCDPSSTRTLKARGAICLAQGRVEEAKDLFARAVSITPDDPSLLTGMGMCLSASGQPGEAMAMFERALAYTPDHLVALHQLLECSYQTNVFSRSESALRRYLSVKPQDTAIRFCLAGVLYKQGLLAAANAELSRVISENGEHVAALELQERIAKEMIMASINQPEIITGVTSDYLQLREQKVSESAALIDDKLDMVEALKQEGRYDDARQALEEVRRSPGVTSGQRERFTCLEAEFMVMDNDLFEADEMYSRILSTNPRFVRALCGKGALAGERQEWIVAQEYFEKALAIEPGHDVALAGLGLCAMVGKKEEKAFELFVQAVGSNPENRRALLGVLQLGYPLKKFTEIEKALNSYLELHPANLDMIYSFAGILFAQGKVEQAKLEIEKILVFEPEHANALELRDLIRGEKPASMVTV